MIFKIFSLFKKLKNLHCPECKAKIKKENIRMADNIFNCDDCEYEASVSDIVNPSSTPHNHHSLNLFNNPKGTWELNEFNKTIIGASKRSSSALFLVPFSIIWGGGSLFSLIIPLISEETVDLDQLLFYIPFFIISVVIGYFALSSIFGKIEISYDFRGGEIFTGIGKIGRTKKFQWSEITAISDEKTNYRVNNKIQRCIKLQGKKNISFATGLSDERRHYLLSKIKKIHDSYS